MFGLKNRNGTVHRRSAELSGAFDGGLAAVTHGLMAGTRVASNLGWRAVEALTVGDKVLTFDNGMQEIVEIRRATVCLDAPRTAEAHWPVTVPVGALGNRAELTLLADQGVLVESDAASDIYGDPFAVVPAQVLEGLRGIYRAAPVQQIDLIVIHFAEEQVIYAEGGTLVHCPVNVLALDVLLGAKQGSYDVLSVHDAAFVAECLVIEDQMMVTGGWVDAQMSSHC